MWAVIRIDHYLEDLFVDREKQESPADILVTVTRLYDEPEVAAREVARLSNLRDPAQIEYFSETTEVCSKSLGPEAVALIGLDDYRNGSRVAREQVRLGGVWESVRAATNHLNGERGVQTLWSIRKARIGAPSVPTR